VREIKFRQPLFKTNGEFFKFHYWGDVDGGFVSPVAGNLGRNSQEYTGLKDKNGKEIYEGDIVRNGKGIIYEVRWYNFGFHLDTPKINGCWTSYTLETYEHLHWSGPSVSPGTEEPKHYKDWHIEIIGNIYENVHG